MKLYLKGMKSHLKMIEYSKWMENMRIVIIANFTRDFSESDNGRFLYLAKHLASNNHEVELITNDFNHGRKERREPITTEYPFKITLLHEPGYKKNVSIQRFYSHHIWGKNLKRYLESIKKPDVVYCAVPSLTGPNYVANFCKKNGIRFVIDIQDLWPEAFEVVLHIPFVFFPIKLLADSIYRKADAICAVSKTNGSRALRVNKNCNNATAVFLGTDLEVFDKYAKGIPIIHKEKSELWLAYCGSLGSSYDLTCVIDALSILKEKNIVIKFVVMGNGPKLEEFQQYAKLKNIDAVFLGRLPYKDMCPLLCECDITINPITHKSAASIINKHGDYAASGLPIVSTQESEEYRSLIDEYQMGFNCNNNDSIDLANKLEKLATDKELRIRMGMNARRCAEEKFDRKTSYKALISEIERKNG